MIWYSAPSRLRHHTGWPALMGRVAFEPARGLEFMMGYCRFLGRAPHGRNEGTPAGTAVFGKTQAVHEPAGLNRTARLAGRTVPRQVRVQDRPREEWTGIPVPALVDEETFDRVQQRLADNKRFASRNTKVPSLLQGIACAVPELAHCL
jgi:hypothetical protein